MWVGREGDGAPGRDHPCLAFASFGFGEDGGVLLGTDDVVRVFYDLEYVFHDPVAYDRLAFFQVCADNYSDNDYCSTTRECVYSVTSGLA